MKAIVSPGQLKGSIEIPASKSDFQRACAAALIHKGTTEIIRPGFSEDEYAAFSVAQSLGLEIQWHSREKIVVSSTGAVKPVAGATVHCGESGLCARLFTPIASLADTTVDITASGTLLRRTMQPLYDFLPALGVSVSGNEPYLPMQIQGPLVPQDFTVDGSLSSQFISGLLFAFAASATVPVVLQLRLAVSVPYLHMSAATLRTFGFDVVFDGREKFKIGPRPVVASHIHYTVEADWSGAAAFCIAGALQGNTFLQGLRAESLQADAALLSLLQEMGCRTEIHSTGIGFPPSSLCSFQFDLTHSPDLAPVLSVLAAAVSGQSTLTGLHRLVHKESNRLTSTTKMLSQLGVAFEVNGDALQIEGGIPIQACTINSYHDHRIVMAATIAALFATGDVTILHAEAVRKSYPDFFNHFAALGGMVHFMEEIGDYF